LLQKGALYKSSFLFLLVMVSLTKKRLFFVKPKIGNYRTSVCRWALSATCVANNFRHGSHEKASNMTVIIWVTLHNLHLEVIDKKNDLLTYMYLKCTKMHHFVINLIKTTAHQMQDFQLDKHQAALPVLFLLTGRFWGFFCPAGATRCTDQGGIWQGGAVCSSLPNFTLIGSGVGVYGPQNWKNGILPI